METKRMRVLTPQEREASRIMGTWIWAMSWRLQWRRLVRLVKRDHEAETLS